MEPVAVFVLMIGIVIVVRLFAGSADNGRIRTYIEQQRGQFLSSRWTPFGRGWFGDKSDRIYEVRYRDRNGNDHVATCKTSLFSGVYFTDDRIVKYSSPRSTNSESEDLKAENARLRAELERLRSADRDAMSESDRPSV